MLGIQNAAFITDILSNVRL